MKTCKAVKRKEEWRGQEYVGGINIRQKNQREENGRWRDEEEEDQETRIRAEKRRGRMRRTVDTEIQEEVYSRCKRG